MKKLFFLFVLSIGVLACKSKEVSQDEDRLPKDVALMPERDSVISKDMDIERDRSLLTGMRHKIEQRASSVSCTDPLKWRISPLGSKPCGGPSSFIAYPIELEDELLPQISTYNQASSSFNLKYGIISDCSVTEAPSGIRCEQGAAVLSYAGAGLQEVSKS